MRKILGVLAAAGMVALGSGAASAQGFSVRIGEPGYRVVQERYERPAYRSRVIERRMVERPRRVRTVCRTVMRERVRPNGVIVRRPTEVCRRVVAGRRYID